MMQTVHILPAGRREHLARGTTSGDKAFLFVILFRAIKDCPSGCYYFLRPDEDVDGSIGGSHDREYQNH